MTTATVSRPRTYTAEEFGHTADQLRKRFAFYIDRFHVPIERKN